MYRQSLSATPSPIPSERLVLPRIQKLEITHDWAIELTNKLAKMQKQNSPPIVVPIKGNQHNGHQKTRRSGSNPKKKISYLCEQNSLGNDEMREFFVENKVIILLIRQKDIFYALSGTCPNCGSRLVEGVLFKKRIRCAIHGSAYSIQSGILEDGVGLDSLWTFRVELIAIGVYVELQPEKMGFRKNMNAVLVNYNHREFDERPTVIIGGGIAGLTCAETLRQKGFNGRIVIISKESNLPYDRKSLSKKLCSPDETRLLRTIEHFEKLHVELLLGRTVNSIHVQEHCVYLESKKSKDALNYSNLVLALGSTNRRLNGMNGLDLEGLCYLRTLDEAKLVAEEVRGKHVAVIGSGFLGLEFASAISATANSVSIYGKAATPLTVLGSRVGNEIRRYMQEEGVTIRQESALRSINGYDRVEQLAFKDGLIAVAETVIVAIGVMPCTSMLLGSGIRTNPEGYILVDDLMHTSIANVFACGDCVNFPFNGKRISLPHWQIAQYQGRVAAYSILGIDYVPKLVPFLWLHLFDRHITFSGDPTIEPEERIVNGTVIDNDFTAYFIKKDLVIGVMSCGKSNLAVQFLEVFRKGIVVNKSEVLINSKNSWTHLLN